MSCLHVFDMDGTLLVGSACIEISRSVGVVEETIAIEQSWAQGEISDNGFWERCLPLWDGLTDEQIDHAFAATPWLDGVDAVFADIRARNENSVVISQSPDFFVERIRRWGANHAYGALVTPGDASGARRMITSDEKLAITCELLGSLGLDCERCVVYGDSMSDLALFENLPRTVAVNAIEKIRELAKVSYDGKDFWQAYLTGRSLIEAGAP